MKSNRKVFEKNRVTFEDIGGIALLWVAAVIAVLVRFTVFL